MPPPLPASLPGLPGGGCWLAAGRLAALPAALPALLLLAARQLAGAKPAAMPASAASQHAPPRAHARKPPPCCRPAAAEEDKKALEGASEELKGLTAYMKKVGWLCLLLAAGLLVAVCGCWWLLEPPWIPGRCRGRKPACARLPAPAAGGVLAGTGGWSKGGRPVPHGPRAPAFMLAYPLLTPILACAARQPSHPNHPPSPAAAVT